MKRIPTLANRSKAILGAALALVTSLNGCGTTGESVATSQTASNASSIWVGAWGASMTNAASVDDNTGGTDRSFRFLVTSTIDGTQARVKFSNVYGTTPVTIGSARLSLGQDGSSRIDPAHDVSLSFGGSSSITMAPGTTVTSDPASIVFGAGQVLAISLYLKGAFGPVSRHDSNFITNYATPDATGDRTTDISGSSFTQTLQDWLLVNEVDVYGLYQGTLALFGSSTTDGLHSNYGSDRVYPLPNVPVAGQHADRLSDQVARRLLASGYRIGVLNAGIPGDTVTARPDNMPSNPPNANDRIIQDVLTLPNLLGVVTYLGSIDLRDSDCNSAPEMETATQRMIATAHAANVPIVLATLPPTALCSNASQPNYGPLPSAADPYAGGLQPGPANGAEVQRAAFNQWMRTTGAGLPGVVGIADFDAALLDPSHPSFMLPPYNSGDNFHMTGAGYQAESQAIPLAFLTAR